MEVVAAKIVVTGGTGFLGRRLCADLSAAGANVIGFGSTDYDLRVRSEADRMLSENQPDAVIHLAAVVGGIGANEREPGRFLYDNAIMGLQLVDACRTAGISRVVIAGTVCSYPKFANLPFREEELWDGYPEQTNAPYGIAKKLLLVQAQAYRDQYGMDVSCLLPVNLYGPGDNFDLETGHVIPAMIRKFVEAEESSSTSVTLWGDGSASREFLYVDDAARAFHLALAEAVDSSPINIGSGEEITISDLASVVARATGYRGRILWDGSHSNGQPRRRLDVTRAATQLGFRATVTLEAGLARTIEWYRSQRLSLGPTSSEAQPHASTASDEAEL